MKLKEWWLLTATAYTCVVVAYCLLQLFCVLPILTPQILLYTLLLASSISLVQVAWDWLSITSRLHCPPKFEVLVDALLRCLLCVVIVLGEGFLFGFIPPKWSSLLFVLPVLVPIFLIAYVVMYFSYKHAQKEADAINEKIRKRK